MRLDVLYDAACPVCIRLATWLKAQPSYVELVLLPSDGAVARQRYADIPQRGAELVIVADDGRVWIGPSAFVMCLWALRAYRPWAQRLASPSLMPVAARMLELFSAKRHRLATLLGWHACNNEACARTPYRSAS